MPGTATFALQIVVRHGLQRNDHRPVALAHAAAAAHQRVVVLDVGIGVKADRRHIVERLFFGAAVQRLDIAQGMRELVSRHANLVRGQAIKHEGVIRVGTMRNGDFPGRIHYG